MNIPDLIGMEVTSSINELIHFIGKYNIVIKITSSPYKKMVNEIKECRVVRQNIHKNNIELIISYF